MASIWNSLFTYLFHYSTEADISVSPADDKEARTINSKETEQQEEKLLVYTYFIVNKRTIRLDTSYLNLFNPLYTVLIHIL